MAEKKVSVKEKKAPEGESAGSKVEQKAKVSIGVDRTDEQILNLNLDKGVELEWDPKDFRRLPAEVVDQLQRVNLVSYVRVESAVDAADRVAKDEVKFTGPRRQLDPLGMYAQHRMQSLEPQSHIKAGWHLYWAAPGADFDTKIAGPYRQVRFQKEDEDKPVGEEGGEVIKLMDGEGKAELILLEIRDELFQEHLEWQSQESRNRFGEVGQNFEQTIEELNKGVKKQARMRVIK
jgi:hypothetical protein